MPLNFRVRNWKLAVLALVLFGFFIGLGAWQVKRAHHKERLIAMYAERTERAPFHASDLHTTAFDWRFYRAELTGTFDNERTILLDNKTRNGQVGYEVYTPFKVNNLPLIVLVDRGFIPMGASRDVRPTINAVEGTVTIMGMLSTPPTYVALGQMNASNDISWPLLVEFINPAALNKFLGYDLFPYILVIDPKNPAAFDVEWKMTNMSPERHMGYAVQWFALALTLLIIFVALNRDRSR